uniref:Transport and Golgi organization protein 1 homolog n=1 Tax=Vombatus ursinus TaxID=29139 RepID=A0A4X2LMI0_VOMUR
MECKHKQKLLMYRGRALQDFTGPDCRFVNFKEGEAVYVYYKLVGRSPELWAGSVGSVFGYFPKDLIEVNHQYSEQELELPTDETDFVCFDGGMDNFDNYDVEDLLGFLGETVRGKGEDELNTSGTESSEKPTEEIEEEHPKKVNIEEPLEVSKDGNDEPETAVDSKVLANSEENSLPSENTKILEEEFETQRPPVNVNSHVDNPQGNQPFLEPLEEMLQDKLKVPESENTKNINIYQLSKDWEEIDAYKLLQKEINLDLKTKFGSTADALVSDDETTRLVTSLEDEFDEELDTDDSKLEEEDNESFDEPPLLTFTNGEDGKTPRKTVVEKYSTGENTEGDPDEIAQLRTDEKNDKNILKTLGDTILSIVGGGEEERDATDLDGSDLDEKKVEDDEKVLTSKWEEDSTPLTMEVPVTNHDKNLDDALEIGMVTEIKEKSERIPSSTEEFIKNGMELGDEDIFIKSPTHETDLKLNNPAEIREDTLKSLLNDMGDDLKGTIIQQPTKGEKSGEKVLDDNLESDLVHKTLWKKMKEKNTEQKSINIKPLLEDEQQNASKGNVDIIVISENEQEQNIKKLDEKIRHSEREIPDQLSKDGSKEMESTQSKDKDIPKDGETNYFKENVGQPLIIETTEFQTEKAEAESDDFYTTEDLLEDENAISAAASDQSSRINADVQMREKATSGVTNLIHTMEDTKEKTSMILETEGIDSSLQESGRTMPKEVTAKVGESVKIAVEQQEKNPLKKDEKSTSTAVSDSFGKDENQALDLVEETNYFEKEDGPKNKKDFGYTERSWPDDFSQEDREYSQNFTDTESQTNQQSDSTELDDNLVYKKAVKLEYSDTIKQLPIIKGFLDEKRVERLEKYLGSENVLLMESTFHDMESKLELTQKESLAYNMEKALDDVFRSSESNILDMVEKMLDSRVVENKELGMKEIDMFDEEAALLDDIQDLIYFVRYKHPLVEESVPLAVAEPPERIEDTPLDTKQHALEIISTEKTPLDTEQHPLGMVSTEDTPLDTEQQLETNPEVNFSQICSSFPTLIFQLIATLPEDIRPGADFRGMPWEPIIITVLLGIVSFAVFFWRTLLSVMTEKQLAEKIKTLLQEKTEILEKMSEYDQKIKKAKESVKETKKQNINLSDEAAGLKDKIRGLEETNQKLDDKVKNLNSLLETEKEQNVKKQDMILETQKSIEKLQEVITMHSVELSEVQIALNEAKFSEEKVKSELHHVQEENARLKKRKEQLLQEAEGWSERHTELSEQIKLYQKTQKDSEEALAYKENEIEVLTNCIMQLKQLDLDSESERKNNEEGNGWDDLANGELSDKITSDNRNEKMKSQIKQMMDVSRNFFFFFTEQIKKMEHDSSSLQSAKAQLENECKTLQQKVEILNELYQQKEMALQKKLTQEEYERQEKEQKLTAADEKVSLVAEEVKTYKQRIQEMEDELQKTERSYKNQIASHEKKAHDNWLIARAAERALAEEKREAANLRQKLIEVNQKIAMLQRPVIVKPTPGRPDHQIPPRRGPLSRDGSFGPSPVSGGAPSPPLMMEPPVRSVSATLNRRDVPRNEFGKQVAFFLQKAVNTGPKGHPPFPGMPLMSPLGGLAPPPLRFGPPPPRGPYGPRPLPPPLVPVGPPPPSFREYLHGLPPGARDLPPDPREYIRGHPPFEPLGPPGPREYLPPGPRLPPPAHGPRDYPPPPFTRDLTPSGSRDYVPPHPPHASQGSTQDYIQAPEQSP